MSILTIGINNNKSVRAKIHNGFWGFKLLFVIGLACGSFFIPGILFNMYNTTVCEIKCWTEYKADNQLETIVMIIGMVGACIFIIIQLLCLIDFSSNWALSWEAAADGKYGSGWLCLIGLTSTSLSMIFFTACYLMYKVFLRRPDGSMCSENGLILCFNGLTSCILLLTSMFCLAQRSRKGLPNIT